MATTKVDTFLGPVVRRCVWTTTADESTAPMHLADLETCAVQVTGTFDGATVTLEVSDNYGTGASAPHADAWVVIPSGSITFAAAGLTYIQTRDCGHRWLRCTTSGAGAGTTLTITAVGRVDRRRS